jgi:hypothetical protein
MEELGPIEEGEWIQVGRKRPLLVSQSEKVGEMGLV